MKAIKFIKRNRTTAGRGTGTILCCLSLPAIDEKYHWRTTPNNPAKAVSLIRKFVNRHLPQNPDLLTGASLVVEAEIRATNTRLERKLLATWNIGDDFDLTLKQASKEWLLLELEEDYIPFEVDI
jgi:hypothetical protein